VIPRFGAACDALFIIEAPTTSLKLDTSSRRAFYVIPRFGAACEAVFNSHPTTSLKLHPVSRRELA